MIERALFEDSNVLDWAGTESFMLRYGHFVRFFQRRTSLKLSDFVYSHGVQIHTPRVGVNIRISEEVRVPAGAFKALRIQAGRETFWYAPSIGWIVKEELGFDNKNRRILELVEYRIPRNT